MLSYIIFIKDYLFELFQKTLSTPRYETIEVSYSNELRTDLEARMASMVQMTFIPLLLSSQNEPRLEFFLEKTQHVANFDYAALIGVRSFFC